MREFEITGLKKSFRLGGREHKVLTNLSLSGRTDEITVILGKSGCGKTTLLRILCGLEGADGGSLVFPSGDRVSMVFQEPRLMPWLNTVKNISFGLPKKEAGREFIEGLTASVGLKGFENAYPAQLSGGMQHRAALARALARRPEMLLLDEPFASLDYFTRLSMQKELCRIHRETGMGGIFVTHNIDEAISIGDRICVLSGGVIISCHIQTDGEREPFSPSSAALRQCILSELEQQPALNKGHL